MSTQDQVRHPLFARIYARLSRSEEAKGVAEHRERLLDDLSGRVIEIGAGNGLNFAHYPTSVEEVVAVEPEPYLRQHAERAASEARVPVRVVDGVAERLPAGDASFDGAVASLVLCSVRDQDAALAEAFRVLRPGGELRFYEHVAAERPLPARLQRAADRTFWPRVSGGCHLGRRTAPAIEAAGFAIESCERVPYHVATFDPVAPHLLGLARRPAG